jgi:divalent metal cation (Fe/Co/Zn/Cd) transporter
MKDEEKKQMVYEAEKQSKLLKNLAKWSRNVMGLSSIGVVVAYYGLSHSGIKFALGVFGVLFTVICVIACLLINLAIRNGRRNVNHILEMVSKR